MRDRVSLLNYYKGFWSVYAFGAGVGFLPPLIHQLLGDSTTATGLLYPPLGDMQTLAVFLTLGFLLSTTLLVFFCCRSTRRIRPVAPIILALSFLVGAGLLSFLYVRYVRVIRVEVKDLNLPMTIGYERTDFAQKWYAGRTDWEMLHDRGPREESVQLLWTSQSIWIVRLALWACYTLTLGSLLSVLSIGVYHHVSEKDPEPALQEE
jgi:hypothetical protein